MKTFVWVLFLGFLSFTIRAQNQQQRIRIADDIELIKLSEKAYVHVSVTEIGSFGLVSSNGAIFIDSGEALLLDTPVTNDQTERLVRWVEDSLGAKVTLFIPNHWHEDCMGGLEYLQQKGVKSYANRMTIAIAKEKGLPLPETGFRKQKKIKFGNSEILCYYPGAGHALDNTAVWIPSEKILFAGCMLKDIHSKGIGNVADGDATAWPKTLDKLARKFPEARIVIPGHGEIGGLELIGHTRQICLDYLK